METKVTVARWPLTSVLKCVGTCMCAQTGARFACQRTQKKVAVLRLEIHYLSQEASGNGRKVRGATGRVEEGETRELEKEEWSSLHQK